MNIDDLKGLLPFYAAGTLEPDEMRTVEEALKTSEELRKELEFWQRAKKAVNVQTSFDAGGHLSAERIVKYAEGALSGEERATVENHLHSCSACTDDYRLVKESTSAPEGVVPRTVDRFVPFIRSVRFIYAVLALAVVVIVAMIMNIQLSRSPEVVQQQTSPPDQRLTPVTPHEERLGRPEGNVMAVWLTYQPTLRGDRHVELPAVYLQRNIDTVNFTLVLPRTFEGGTYLVALTSPAGRSRNLGAFDPVGKGLSHDSVLVQLERGSLESDGTYTITAQEVLTGEAAQKGFTPESPYIIRFVLKQEN